MSINGVIFQSFQWYTEGDGAFWARLAQSAKALKEAGFTAVWHPPAYKGLGGAGDVGYGVYDLYDLGEFFQKGTTRTKYGTRDEYLAAVKAMKDAGLQVYADAVLNHLIGGDEAEELWATPYYQNDRRNPAGGKRKIRTYTKFTFPGRGGKHCPDQWDGQHFDAVDYDENNPGGHEYVYLLEGKIFDDEVALEKGNFAYLLGCDKDYQHPEVRDRTIEWGKWYLSTTGVDGFRIDALKHISAWFFPEWLKALRDFSGKELFSVGEYWSPSIDDLFDYLGEVGHQMSLFDVPLHMNFHHASRMGDRYDLRKILDGTLVRNRPVNAVTFVENHDSQPLQALETVVEPWFKPLAYAIILLRAEGYPCVFEPDYRGASYQDRGKDGNLYRIDMPSHGAIIDKLLAARRDFAHGPQYDYLDYFSTIGWTRLGDAAHPRAMAVLMSNGAEGFKWMEAGKPNASFSDITGNMAETITANEYGWAEFKCLGGSVSVWVEQG